MNFAIQNYLIYGLFYGAKTKQNSRIIGLGNVMNRHNRSCCCWFNVKNILFFLLSYCQVQTCAILIIKNYLLFFLSLELSISGALTKTLEKLYIFVYGSINILFAQKSRNINC